MKTYLILDSDKQSIGFIDHVLINTGRFIPLGNTINCKKAQNLILTRQPDLLFINVDGVFGNAFEFVINLQSISHPSIGLVALSSGTEFAYQSIKHGFYDYLLTPITAHDLSQCITGILNKYEANKDFICLKSYKDFHFLKTKEILLLRADNNTTDFHLRHGEIITAFKTLKTFEDKLPAYFKRIHKSYIINTRFINRIDFGKGICKLKHFKGPIPFSKKYVSTMESIFYSLSKIMF